MPFDIQDFSVNPLDESYFVKPVRLDYAQNGKQRSWEAVQAHDSVAILLYHLERQAFLLVKQFRAPVHMNHSQFTFTYELCAGILDKSLPLEQIAKEEILEECGYDIPAERIFKVSSFFTNVGISGNRQHLYFATLNDKYRVSAGGGIHNEEIILEYLPLKQAKEFIYNESLAKTPGLMFSFYWFFEKFGPNAEQLSQG